VSGRVRVCIAWWGCLHSAASAHASFPSARPRQVRHAAGMQPCMQQDPGKSGMQHGHATVHACCHAHLCGKRDAAHTGVPTAEATSLVLLLLLLPLLLSACCCCCCCATTTAVGWGRSGGCARGVAARRQGWWGQGGQVWGVRTEDGLCVCRAGLRVSEGRGPARATVKHHGH